MDNTMENPSKAAEPQVKPLAEFGELMMMVTDMPKEDIEKVTIYASGVMAGARALSRR